MNGGREQDGLSKMIHTNRVDLIVVSLSIMLVEDMRGNIGSMVRIEHGVSNENLCEQDLYMIRRSG